MSMRDVIEYPIIQIQGIQQFNRREEQTTQYDREERRMEAHKSKSSIQFSSGQLKYFKGKGSNVAVKTSVEDHEYAETRKTRSTH